MKTYKFKLQTQQIHQKTLQHNIRKNLQKAKKLNTKKVLHLVFLHKLQV